MMKERIGQYSASKQPTDHFTVKRNKSVSPINKSIRSSQTKRHIDLDDSCMVLQQNETKKQEDRKQTLSEATLADDAVTSTLKQDDLIVNSATLDTFAQRTIVEEGPSPFA